MSDTRTAHVEHPPVSHLLLSVNDILSFFFSPSATFTSAPGRRLFSTELPLICLLYTGQRPALPPLTPTSPLLHLHVFLIAVLRHTSCSVLDRRSSDGQIRALRSEIRRAKSELGWSALRREAVEACRASTASRHSAVFMTIAGACAQHMPFFVKNSAQNLLCGAELVADTEHSRALRVHQNTQIQPI